MPTAASLSRAVANQGGLFNNFSTPGDQSKTQPKKSPFSKVRTIVDAYRDLPDIPPMKGSSSKHGGSTSSLASGSFKKDRVAVYDSKETLHKIKNSASFYNENGDKATQNSNGEQVKYESMLSVAPKFDKNSGMVNSAS